MRESNATASSRLLTASRPVSQATPAGREAAANVRRSRVARRHATPPRSSSRPRGQYLAGRVHAPPHSRGVGGSEAFARRPSSFGGRRRAMGDATEVEERRRTADRWTRTDAADARRRGTRTPLPTRAPGCRKKTSAPSHPRRKAHTRVRRTPSQYLQSASGGKVVGREARGDGEERPGWASELVVPGIETPREKWRRTDASDPSPVRCAWGRTAQAEGARPCVPSPRCPPFSPPIESEGCAPCANSKLVA